jgi:hypothetical protein
MKRKPCIVFTMLSILMFGISRAQEKSKDLPVLEGPNSARNRRGWHRKSWITPIRNFVKGGAFGKKDLALIRL